MNLIEQFGYEKAKDALDQLKREKKDLLTVGKTVLVRAEIEQNLLEYRRQHNIFEVGDWVVEITEFPEIYILRVTYMSDRLMVCENDSLNASYSLLNEKPLFYVKHATDAEIKAGRRL